MNSGSFEYRGNKISYQWKGSGKPVFLLHGFGEDSRVWETFLPQLDSDRCYILPDLPGYGRSRDLVNFEELADMESHAELMKALSAELVNSEVLTHEQLSKSCWIGHSMGGYIALALLAHHPEISGSLLLFHSTAFADSEEKKELRRKSMEFIQTHGATAFLQQAIPNLFTEDFVKLHPEKITGLVAKYNYLSPETLCQNYQLMMNRPERIDLLQSTQKPIGFIIGGQDKAVPVKDSLFQCQIPKNSYIQFLSGSAHMGMMENPLETARFLEWFLQHT